MKYRMWKGRKVQIWNMDRKRFIGIGIYIGSQRMVIEGDTLESAWIKIFEIQTGKFKNHTITELECKWNPVKVGLEETTGLK